MGVIPIETEKKRVNWSKIRSEYINGASYGDLSKKYKLSKSTIFQHAKQDSWQTLRTNAANEARTRVIQKTAEAAADNAVIAARIKTKALLLLERLMDSCAEMQGTEHRQTDRDADTVNIMRLRDLTAAYKDLTEDLTSVETDKNAPVYELLKRLDGECDV